MKKLYFLGPVGTYSEDAAIKINEILYDEYELIPVSTIAKIVELVDNDKNSTAILPIENSIEGIVRQTIDNIYLKDVMIKAQIDIKIKHSIVSKNNDKKQIKHIISHPQALAQCSNYINQNFDETINLVEGTSTAASYYSLNNKDNSWAAIVSNSLAQNGKYNILDTNIGDIKENKTRFILISKDDLSLGDETRTSIVFNTKNEPGALLKILEIISKNGLNLVYLESRPSKKVFGEYNFFCDIDKGQKEIASTLNKIQAACNYYKLLGSYCIF